MIGAEEIAAAGDDEGEDDEGEEEGARLGELVADLARRLRRSSAARLEQFGLSNGQARVLRLVARAGRPLRMSEIARKVEVVPRSATTVVDGLERRGFVTREADPHDRRSVLVRLTAGGEEVLVALGRDRDEAALDLFGRLAAGERAELGRLLAAVLGADAPGTTQAHEEAGAP